MSFLLTLFQTVWTWIAKGVAWLFGAAKKSGGMSPWAYQLIHFFVVILVTLLLGFFSRSLPGGNNIGFGSAFVRNHYWGILFILLYLFVRMVLYVVSLFRIEEESEFPEIDEAWALAMEGLEAEGLDIQNLPVFLVAGLPADEEAAFFSGAKFEAKVIAPSADQRRMPIRFFANHDALFISCSGVSSICRQELSKSGMMSGRSAGENQGTLTGESTQMPNHAGGGQTLAPGQMGVGQTLAPGNFGVGQTLQPGALSAIQTLSPGAGAAAARQGAVRDCPPLSDDELEACGQGLRYVCRLLTQSRQPFCPMNGLLLAVPLEWSNRMNQGIYQSIRKDLTGLHQSLQMHFPVVCVFSGLNQLNGLDVFIQRSAEVDPRFGAQLRAGSHFPMGHTIDTQAANWVIHRGIEWFRRWIYSAFAKSLTNQSNTILYRLLCDLDGRRQQLANLLKTAFADATEGEPIRLCGCYFSGLDASAKKYVFVKDVVDKLISEQNNVAWSPQRIWQDESRGKWTKFIYAGIGLLAVVNLWLAYSLL